MGVTLIAILTAALLLPGIVAARTFYRAGQTNEIEPTASPLSSTDGIALVGVFSIVVHFLYVVGLKIALTIPTVPPFSAFPTANPYALFRAEGPIVSTVDQALSLLSALVLLCITALLVGSVFGRMMMRRDDKSVFYGPMAEPLATTGSDADFVMAYVLAKLEMGGRTVGYQGTVVSLVRDDDRFPAKVVLKNVSVFYLTVTHGQIIRREMRESIDWIALARDDWHNIAFKVFKIVPDVIADQVTARRAS